MRLPWPALLGSAVVLVLGIGGLVRGSMPQSPTDVSSQSDSQPIVVSNAYVRASAPPTDSAAAYFTVFNTTSTPDVLQSVTSGAGASSMMHTASMSADAGGVTIAAHGKLVLSTGHGHVMIEHLFGRLQAGQTVNMDLTFEHAGIVSITAKVIALGVPVPTGGS